MEQKRKPVADARTAGITCPGCGEAEFTVSEQRFKDGTQHVRVDCRNCQRFVRYLPRDRADDVKPEPTGDVCLMRPRPQDAHARELEAPQPRQWWVGYIRQDDRWWRPVALCRTLARCWDAMMTYRGKGDILIDSADPPEQRQEELFEDVL